MSVFVTVLAGRRPEYLRRTLEAFEPVLRSATGLQTEVLCWVNGADAPSLEVARERPWVSRVEAQARFLPIGKNVSRLAALARESHRSFWLHLEDDWTATGNPGWLSDACDVLAREPQVGQLRLRCADEPVSKSNLVSHRMIRWSPRPIFKKAGCLSYRTARAHVTYNPSIQRCLEAHEWMIASSEPEAMRRFHRTKLLAAQVYPGVFRHIGEQSLRRDAR